MTVDYVMYVPWSLRITAYSPVDIAVIDPSGNVVSKTANGIRGATYLESDLDGDGHTDDRVTIVAPLTGVYTIQVTPEVGADPDDRVTLVVEDRGNTATLLNNVRVADLPTTPMGLNVERSIHRFGDCNGNGHLDSSDFASLRGCMAGPASNVPAECDCADINLDGDVDLADFGNFQIEFGGSQ
jgi:hypothetical protein